MLVTVRNSGEFGRLNLKSRYFALIHPRVCFGRDTNAAAGHRGRHCQPIKLILYSVGRRTPIYHVLTSVRGIRPLRFPRGPALFGLYIRRVCKTTMIAGRGPALSLAFSRSTADCPAAISLLSILQRNVNLDPETNAPRTCASVNESQIDALEVTLDEP